MTPQGVFAVCAVAGGTLMIVQFLLSALGWGHAHEGGFDSHDLAGGHDVGHDAAHDDMAAHSTDHDQHAATWFFSVLTFRTVTAGLTFFGLAGLAAEAAHWPTTRSFLAAAAAGGGALYGVHYLMRGLNRLRSDGTIYTHELVGARGQVYLRVPADGQLPGKVHLVFKGRMLEYEAVTEGGELKPSDRVEVVGLAGPEMLRVRRAV